MDIEMITDKEFNRDDLKGHQALITSSFASDINRNDHPRDKDYTLGVVVDYWNSRVWLTDRHGNGVPWSEFVGDEFFIKFNNLGKDDVERFYIARLVDDYLKKVKKKNGRRAITEEQKEVVVLATSSFICTEVEDPLGVELMDLRKTALEEMKNEVEK